MQFPVCFLNTTLSCGQCCDKGPNALSLSLLSTAIDGFVIIMPWDDHVTFAACCHFFESVHQQNVKKDRRLTMLANFLGKCRENQEWVLPKVTFNPQ
jgi:hypothetical protein